MNYLKHLARVAGLGLCVVAFAGTAVADPGKGNGNGPAVTPPGQERKAEQAAEPAPIQAQAAPAAPQSKGQEQKAEQQAKQAQKRAQKAASKPAKAASKPAPQNKGQARKAEQQAAKATKQASRPATSGSYKNTSSGTNEDKPEQTHRHTICHATGSSSNPYVRITPSISGVYHGHTGHQGGEDIIPPYTYRGQTYSQNWDAEGQAIFNAGCEVPAPAPAVHGVAPAAVEEKKAEECPTAQTTTQRVLVGVWHATAAVKNGQRKYVFITPSLNSAHYDSSKHPDDTPVYEERTVTTQSSGEECRQVAAQSPVLPAPPVTPPAEQQPHETPAPETAGVASAPTGGVAGAVSPSGALSPAGAVSPAGAPAAEEAEGGVLGAVASAPEAIARTGTQGTLPFTGIPLWIAALLGAGLLLGGLGLRRAL